VSGCRVVRAQRPTLPSTRSSASPTRTSRSIQRPPRGLHPPHAMRAHVRPGALRHHGLRGTQVGRPERGEACAPDQHGAGLEGLLPLAVGPGGLLAAGQPASVPLPPARRLATARAYVAPGSSVSSSPAGSTRSTPPSRPCASVDDPARARPASTRPTGRSCQEPDRGAASGRHRRGELHSVLLTEGSGARERARRAPDLACLTDAMRWRNSAVEKVNACACVVSPHARDRDHGA
jgi:hypothetical protein